MCLRNAFVRNNFDEFHDSLHDVRFWHIHDLLCILLLDSFLKHQLHHLDGQVSNLEHWQINPRYLSMRNDKNVHHLDGGL